tara:strand:+ start:5688 stop:6173 length:486 start_codon:yes stop_codon:yes gene_type:complete
MATCKITLFTEHGERVFIDSATEVGKDRKIQEKCSSHSLGRALSLAGYQGVKFGQNAPIASREEMESFQQDNKPILASAKQMNFIRSLAIKAFRDNYDLLQKFNIKSKTPIKVVETNKGEYSVSLGKEELQMIQVGAEYQGRMDMNNAKAYIEGLKKITSV